MIKSILKLAVVVVLGVLGYNFFLGDAEEKEQSKKIFNEGGKIIKKAAEGTVSILKAEYGKFKEGKYDKALDKVGGLLKKAKQKGGEYVEDIKVWEEKTKEWKERKDKLIEMIDEQDGEINDTQKEEMQVIEEEGKVLTEEGKALQKKADKE